MSANTVKIVRFYKKGGPEVLQIENIPLPEPGKGEVRLRVHAFALNRAEVMFREGAYLIEPEFPSKIGYEASGVVDAVGPGVDNNLIGKKYSTVPCFDLGKYGVYGEVAIVPAEALAAYPEKLSDEEATSIWMQFITVYGALVYYGKLKKHDFVVITAASSSVGIAAIQVARAQGAISIATTRTAKKKADLLEQGADHVIVTDDEDLVTRVHEITHGKGATMVFDPVAGKGVERLANTLGQGGMLVLYGNLSSEPSTPFPLFPALAKGLTVRGYTLFEILTNPEVRAKAEKYVYEHVQNGTLTPIIARRFPLAQIVQAHQYMESNAQVGKIVVTVGN